MNSPDVYRLALPFMYRILVFGVMALISLVGVWLIVSIVWADEGVPAVIAAFWCSVLAWNWIVLLRIPYAIRFETADRIAFVALAGRTEVMANDVRWVKPYGARGWFLHTASHSRQDSIARSIHGISRSHFTNQSCESSSDDRGNLTQPTRTSQAARQQGPDSVRVRDRSQSQIPRAVVERESTQATRRVRPRKSRNNAWVDALPGLLHSRSQLTRCGVTPTSRRAISGC